jgi:hypothetical protein
MVLALGLAVPAMAQTAQQQINNGLCTGSNLEFTDNPTDQCAAAGSDATTQINNIVHTIVNLLSAIVGIVAVIMIIVGGFRYITSGGNDTSVTSAKNTILFLIISYCLKDFDFLDCILFHLGEADGQHAVFKQGFNFIFFDRHW